MFCLLENVENHAYWQTLSRNELRFQESPGIISRSEFIMQVIIQVIIQVIMQGILQFIMQFTFAYGNTVTINFNKLHGL